MSIIPSKLNCLFALVCALPLASFGATKIYEETSGRVVVEAEHFTDRVGDPAGPHWHVVPDDDGDGDTTTPYENARGKFVQVLPDAGINKNAANLVGLPPYLEYKVNINTPGQYQLYLRWKGWDGSSDSVYAQILELSTPQWYRFGDGANPDELNFNSTGSGTGWDGIAAPDNNGGGGGEVPAVYDLGGGVFTIRISQREDGSAVDALILQLASLAAPTGNGPAESGLAASYVAILQPPQSATATPGTTATFAVQAEGTGTLTYQWQQRSPGAATYVDIGGATAKNYTTPPTTDGMNGTMYRVVVSNGAKSAASAPATLTTDSTPPSVVRATSGPSNTSLTIQFSEKLDPATAQDISKYTINGLTVSGASLSAAGTSVGLRTAAQAAGTSYTVTVTGVKDAAGNAMAAAGTAQFKGAKAVPGKLLVRLYRNIGGTAVANLTNDPKFPNLPDEISFWEVFGPFENNGDNFGENYGGEATGLYTAPATGAYKFYIRSDDASALFLGTDDTPSSMRQIAAQGGCCNAFTDAPGGLSSQPINLEKGKKYFIRGLWKEGGGGDYLQVGVLGPNDADINDAASVVPIPGEFLSTGYDENATLNITQAPSNLTVPAGTAATFTVQYNAYNSIFGTKTAIQWQKAPAGGGAFADIAGANSATFTIPFASTGDSLTQYRVVLTTGNAEFGTLGTVTSSAATLTVSADTIKPTVTSFSGSIGSAVIGFSEPLDDVSAKTLANYKISGGASISGATVISGAGQAGRVQLNLNGVAAGGSYTITVSGVKDPAGNASDSSSHSFTAYHIYAEFNDGQVPPGMTVVGAANAKAVGGLNNTGFLELTTNAGSLQGSLNIDDPLSGAEATKFTVWFKIFVGRGSGNPADGYSFSMASDLTPETNTGEEGTGGGLTIAFDTYDNGAGEAPAIDVKWAGGEVISTKVPKSVLVNNRWVDVVIQVDSNGRLTVQHDNVKYYDKLDIGWSPIAGPRITIGARTGGEFETHWIENLAVLYNADVVLPQPPTISITSPANGSTLTAGQAANLTVAVADPENQIVSVEYFANGQSLAKLTTAPYSLSIPAVPAGLYSLTAQVIDGQGLAVMSTPSVVTVRPPAGAKKALFVHGGSGPNASDTLVIADLFARGLDVYTVGDTASQTSDADGKAIVVISSTVGSGNVTDKFTASAVPVMNWEQALQDNLLYTLDVAGTSRDNIAAQTQLQIVNAGHPLAAGLSGTVTVSTTVDYSWGLPADSAVKIAKTTDGNDRYPIYAYDKGALLIDGSTVAAERRVHIFFTDATYGALNSDGKKLFNAAVDWLLGGAQLPPPVVSVARNGEQVTVTWTNGGTLEKATAASGPYTSTGDSDGSYGETLGTGAVFYRVRR